jgi:hypothetical protein
MEKKISRRKFATTVAELAAAGLAGVAVTGSNPTFTAPADNTISKLMLDRKIIAALTDGAKKVTKKDLNKLEKWIAGGRKGDAPLKLTEKDLDSVNAAWKAHKAELARTQSTTSGASCVSCCTCSCAACARGASVGGACAAGT